MCPSAVTCTSETVHGVRDDKEGNQRGYWVPPLSSHVGGCANLYCASPNLATQLTRLKRIGDPSSTKGCLTEMAPLVRAPGER